MSMRVHLHVIVFDAGTQIRAAINDATVAEYAERMTDGAVFPPVVLFHDGNQYYMADGFHRALAAQRNQFRDISADVRPGTKQDALWFALGANKTNGQRLTDADKKHAIVLAFKAWPDKSQTQIAEQIGCSQRYVSTIREQVRTSSNLPSHVTGKDGKSYPASRRQTVASTPVPPIDRSKGAATARRARLRAMAAEGYSSRQMAAAVGISEQGCRDILRVEGIAVPADRIVGHTRRLDPNRIVGQMVSDAENLCADVTLIAFSKLDRPQLSAWIASLHTSRRALSAFIRRLEQEHAQHGEATDPASVQDSSGPTGDDARPAGLGDPA